jgi:uncharacterized protein (TIGR02996 family)
MLQDETFIQAILDNPQEEANWLVYADWLEERGDSRAAFYRWRRLTDSLGVEFVLVPRGAFWMGGGGGKPGNWQVQIAHEFYLGVYPVTQGQWQAVMGSNPSYFSRTEPPNEDAVYDNCFDNPTGGGYRALKNIPDAELKEFPVECVSWEDTQEFIRKLNQRAKAHGDWVYRLPTVEEWEYACRGGARSREECSFDFYLDRPTNTLSSTQANFIGAYPAGGAARGPDLVRTTKVGSYPPNRLGIYDLHGNVWEWTASAAPRSGRVFRGGGWRDAGSGCRAASATNSTPAFVYFDLGFRLALGPSAIEGG